MTAEHGGRVLPCHILQDNNIPCVLWCEDAVRRHGVPIVLFAIHILVPDLDEAATALMKQSWHLEDGSQTLFGNFILQNPHRRLSPPTTVSQNTPAGRSTGNSSPPSSKWPGQGSESVILLPGADWKFPLVYGRPQGFYPPLPELLDSLIEHLLDLNFETDKIWSQLYVLIAYLYEYVPRVKEKSFAAELKYEHRQFHYDTLSEMISFTVPFLRHEQKIRDALHAGSFQLCDCSGDRNDEDLFNDKVQARLRASMGDTCTPEQYEADKQRELEEERALWAEQEG